jgi:hypothetical protein
MDNKDREYRIKRANSAELQKIELCVTDIKDLEIDTRILNKLKNKMRR